MAGDSTASALTGAQGHWLKR
ncbi:hypothetical protein [Photorhabdus sp. S14-60]